MQYAKVTGTTVNQFPYTLRDLKADNPNVSFPNTITLDDVAQYGVVVVTQLSDPVFDLTTQRLEQGVPVFNDPNWEVTQIITALTAQEQTDYATVTARNEDVDLLKADAEVLALLKARPAQINNYIENNVTNLAEAKTVLKILARAVSVLAHTVIN